MQSHWLLAVGADGRTANAVMIDKMMIEDGIGRRCYCNNDTRRKPSRARNFGFNETKASACEWANRIRMRWLVRAFVVLIVTCAVICMRMRCMLNV